ncbi:hypothetical protein [Aeromonas diversa]|uniref:hypothetical protein n=1 Tax=Aeromonas diversa TaxID=502790 RepID=UPI0034633471
MDTSDVIALLAFLVAGLSALYARWSWAQAKRANEISLLGHKKEIYDAFFELRMHMMQKAEFADLGEVSKFYYPSRNASIYLPSELAESIEKYYEACFWLAEINRKNGGLKKEGSIEAEPHIKTERELAPKIEKDVLKLLKSAQA